MTDSLNRVTTSSSISPVMACDVLVIGGGPAGLRAAEVVSAAGWHTILADQMPSVGRKFLVAGRGGLNLTHSEPLAQFVHRYGGSLPSWASLLADFTPTDLQAWVHGLGVETFVGTSGRVFPESKQAAPLLRRWVARLREQSVLFRLRHRLTGLQRQGDSWEARFSTPKGECILRASALILALGGASWPQTGSDGQWTSLLSLPGLELAPFVPANCGYEVAWSPNFLVQAEGLPLKNIAVTAEESRIEGELLVTKYGLEGGALYQLGSILRKHSSPRIEIDLKPALLADALRTRLGSKITAPASLDAAARAWRLSSAATALLGLHAPFTSWDHLIQTAKSLPLTLIRPRPIEEAISSAGGVRAEGLDDFLMLRTQPGIFCAGEMLDWDAPTGGYLLQGCLATASRAARGALRFLQPNNGLLSSGNKL